MYKLSNVQGFDEHAHYIFFYIKGIVNKEFVLAGQTVDSAYYLVFYGGCMKMCKDFALNSGDKMTGCCITKTHHLTLFLQGEFLTKTTLLLSHTHSTFLFPLLKIKLKGRHFDTN
jgi:hypothetical protein